MNKIRIFISAAGLLSLTAVGAEYILQPGEDALQLRDRIRAERASGKIGEDEPVTITLAPGDYPVAKTLVLEAADSGTEKGPVTWRAEKPGTVRILGGVVIPPTAFRPVSGEARERLDPAVADKVLEADVRPLLLREPAPWPDGPQGGRMPGPWLYVGGKSQQLARWPNIDAPEGGWVGFTNALEQSGYEADKRAKKPAVLEFPGDRAERWRYDEGVWFMGYFVVEWDCDLRRIASFDKATHGARFAGITKYGVGGNYRDKRFCAVNLLEELDVPREWYYDRKSGKLCWYPGTDEGEIVLALDLTPFVKIDRARYIRLENLSFTYSHGENPLILMKGAERCLVKDCAFDSISYLAVNIEGGTRNRVTGCRMTNFGAAVARIDAGDRKNLLPANNLIDHCTVENNGMYQRSHSKAFELAGCGNAIRNCRVSNAPEGAVNYSGNEHLIADNDFGNIVLEVRDAGAIYTGYHADWLGTLIFGNHIHHLAKTEAEEVSRCAIYFDDCDWGDDVIGNTLDHCGMGFLVGGGKLHGLYNNLVSNCRAALSIDGRGRDWRNRTGSFSWSKSGRTFAEYTHDEAGIDPDRPPWRVAYPRLREAMDNRPEYPLMNEIAGNTFVNCRKKVHSWGFPKELIDLDLPGNAVVANAASGGLRAKQPIRLSDAAFNRLESADGSTVVKVLLDESGHLAWMLDVDECPILGRSPLGITVDSFDFGRRVVPGTAKAKGDVSFVAFTNATRQIVIKNRHGEGLRNAHTNLAVFVKRTAREWRIPIRSLITGRADAFLDVRVWNGGAAYRWTVPGKGERRVVGENDAFIPADGRRESIEPLEWERDADLVNGYPESLYYERGAGWGIMFPEFAHGWRHVGPVVSPWRGVSK